MLGSGLALLNTRLCFASSCASGMLEQAFEISLFRTEGPDRKCKQKMCGLKVCLQREVCPLKYMEKMLMGKLSRGFVTDPAHFLQADTIGVLLG